MKNRHSFGDRSVPWVIRGDTAPRLPCKPGRHWYADMLQGEIHSPNPIISDALDWSTSNEIQRHVLQYVMERHFEVGGSPQF